MIEKEFSFWLRSSNFLKITEKIFTDRDVDTAKTNESKAGLKLDHNKGLEYNLFIIKEILVDEKLFCLFEFILRDMYKFSFQTTSIISNNSEKYTDDYKLLKNVDLLSHSFGVFNNITYITNNSLGIIRDYIFLSALTHDFGKSKELCLFYKISEEKHHKASAKYLQTILTKKYFACHENILNERYYNFVSNALFIHHDDIKIDSTKEKTNKSFEDLILKFLKKSDIKQREFELRAQKRLLRG